MKVIYPEQHARHATTRRIEGYPAHYHEVPARAEVILSALRSANLGPIEAPRDFGQAPIVAVHDTRFVDFLRTAYAATRSVYENPESPVLADTYDVRSGRHLPRGAAALVGYYAFDTSCPILAGTWTAAYWSAQAALTAADLVRRGERAVYALCRPPGHHVFGSQFGGYCYLNNAAIAARALQASTSARVAIIDIDYHHGNGTQEVFYSDPNVLFCSLHADPDTDYPYYWGGADETGEGPGKGYNRNWPLPQGTKGPAYLEALHEMLSAVSRFEPRYLVVSVGFDLMAGDPVQEGAGLQILPDDLAMIAHLLHVLKLPTVLIQEGGYNLEKLGSYATTFLCEFA